MQREFRDAAEVLGDLAYCLDLLYGAGRAFGGVSQLLIRPVGDGEECSGFELDLQLVRASKDVEKEVAMLSKLHETASLRSLVGDLLTGVERIHQLAREIDLPEEGAEPPF